MIMLQQPFSSFHQEYSRHPPHPCSSFLHVDLVRLGKHARTSTSLLLAAEGVLDGTANGALVRELLANHAVRGERAADGLADLADGAGLCDSELH